MISCRLCYTVAKSFVLKRKYFLHRLACIELKGSYGCSYLHISLTDSDFSSTGVHRYLDYVNVLDSYSTYGKVTGREEERRGAGRGGAGREREMAEDKYETEQ